MKTGDESVISRISTKQTNSNFGKDASYCLGNGIIQPDGEIGWEETHKGRKEKER